MDILPGFNKTIANGAHSIYNDCPVSDPEVPTGSVSEGFENPSLDSMNKTQKEPTIKIDLVGWIGTAVLVGILGIGLFIATLARNKAIWSALDDQDLTVQPTSESSEGITGWIGQLFMNPPEDA